MKKVLFVFYFLSLLGGLSSCTKEDVSTSTKQELLSDPGDNGGVDWGGDNNGEEEGEG